MFAIKWIRPDGEKSLYIKEEDLWTEHLSSARQFTMQEAVTYVATMLGHFRDKRTLTIVRIIQQLTEEEII